MRIPHITRYRVAKAAVITRNKSKSLVHKATYVANEINIEKEKMLSALIFANSIAAHLPEAAMNAPKVVIKTVEETVPASARYASSVKMKKVHTPKIAETTKLMAEKENINAQMLKFKFDSLLLDNEKHKNPLNGKGGVFIAKAREKGVNPVVLMAISLHESARGASVLAKEKHNIGGIMVKRGKKYVPKHFSNVNVCIADMSDILKTHNQASGIQTVKDLAYAGKYCAKSEAKEWINAVMYYVNQLQEF